MSGFFLGRETASVMPSVEAKNFVDRVEDKTTKHKNRFDLRVADFSALRRASQSSALTKLMLFLRRIVLGRVAASVRPSVEV